MGVSLGVGCEGWGFRGRDRRLTLDIDLAWVWLVLALHIEDRSRRCEGHDGSGDGQEAHDILSSNFGGTK